MIPWRNHWSNPWFCSHNADCISGFMKENLIPCFLERLDLNQPNGSGSACLAMNSLPYSYYASVAKPKSGSGSMPMCMHTAFSFSGFSLGCPGVFVRIWSRWGEKPDQMGKTFHGSLWSIHTAYASMKNCKWGNPEQFIMPGNSELRVGGHYFKWNFSRKIKIKTKNNNNRTENQGQWWKSIDFFCKLQMGWREPQVIEMLLWEHGPAVLHLVSMCLLWSRRCIGHWTHNNEQSGPVLGDADDKKANTKNYNRDNRESCGSTEKERLYQTLGVEQGQCRLPRRNDIHAESK